MRRLILLFAAGLAVAACGKSNQTENSNMVTENLTADSIVSNDVTAIDAVTGDAANMAADVDMNYGELGNQSSEIQSSDAEKPAARPKSKPEVTATENGSSNSASNSTSNAD